MKTPEFKYQPIRLSYEQKLKMLSKLKPVKGHHTLKLVLSFLLTMSIVAIIAYSIARLGQIYGF
jgi:hypothetical protein